MEYLLRHYSRHFSDTVTNLQRCSTGGTRRWLSLTAQNDECSELRVLFCGSDEFSICSLEALHKYAQTDGSKVRSIEVATRTDKRTGRGLKNITAPPIKNVAHQLGLRVHQFDTFRDWNLPTQVEASSTYINMIVAVSFGLLVPPRILKACRFGGLNVHPSMLPDLKGSAPVEHTIINGYNYTGITVQTLHPSKFDEGQIVLQTPPPGIAVPNPDQITADELKNILAPIGADMLIQTIDKSLYLGDLKSPTPSEDLKHASKITTESRHVDFRKLDASCILRFNRALSRLWIRAPSAEDSQREIRLILGQALRLAQPRDLQGLPPEVIAGLETGLPFAVARRSENIKHTNAPLLVKTLDSSMLLIPDMLVSGMKIGPAAAKAAKADLFEAPLRYGEYELYRFREFPD